MMDGIFYSGTDEFGPGIKIFLVTRILGDHPSGIGINKYLRDRE
jgi:hypothetical protein